MTPVRAVWRQVAGWSLLALGVLGWLVPILPGWLLIGAGALLLAPHVRMFRRLAALIHARFPALRPGLRRFRARVAPP